MSLPDLSKVTNKFNEGFQLQKNKTKMSKDGRIYTIEMQKKTPDKKHLGRFLSVITLGIAYLFSNKVRNWCKGREVVKIHLDKTKDIDSIDKVNNKALEAIGFPKVSTSSAPNKLEHIKLSDKKNVAEFIKIAAKEYNVELDKDFLVKVENKENIDFSPLLKKNKNFLKDLINVLIKKKSVIDNENSLLLNDKIKNYRDKIDHLLKEYKSQTYTYISGNIEQFSLDEVKYFLATRRNIMVTEEDLESEVAGVLAKLDNLPFLSVQGKEFRQLIKEFEGVLIKKLLTDFRKSDEFNQKSYNDFIQLSESIIDAEKDIVDLIKELRALLKKNPTLKQLLEKLKTTLNLEEPGENKSQGLAQTKQRVVYLLNNTIGPKNKWDSIF